MPMNASPRPRNRLFSTCAALLVAALLTTPLPAQPRGASALGPLVEGLGTSARVLVIAAHPDDEDTQLITWLAKGRHVETAYLSLTRGDGGQNLIGNELGEALGAIRTEELLAARRLDGGRQYFTRAYDFGFSKNAEETLTQWSRDSILRDVVTVVRQFRPHVIVAVFSGTPADGHGHHQVSGIFAREAYDAAGDTVRFPRAATAGHGGWTVAKFYRSANFRMQERATLRMNVGEYNPVLGRSYSEVAADSRSQHKSQAMGSLQQKGVRWDQVIREAARVPGAPADAKSERGLFDGIDTTWSRFASIMTSPAQRAALDSLPAAFAAARAALDLTRPGTLVAPLVRVQRLLRAVCPTGPSAPCLRDISNPPAGLTSGEVQDEVRVGADVIQVSASNGDLASAWSVASERTGRALALAMGAVVEATATREVWATGERVPVAVRVFNRGERPFRVEGITVFESVRQGAGAKTLAATIAPDSVLADSIAIPLAGTTQPWWLRTPRRGAMFAPRVLGTSETARRAAVSVWVTLRVDSAAVLVEAPVVYRYADAIKGEIQHPIAAAPAITVSLDDAVAYAPANAPMQRAIRVYVRSHASEAREVAVSLQLPAGLQADSAERRVAFPANGRPAPAGPGAAFGIGGGAVPELVRVVTFNVRGRLAAGRHVVSAVATSNGASFTTGYTAIAYDHIRPQRLYRPATLGIEAVDVKLPRAVSIAYITGVGDNVAPMLEQLGVNVTVVDPAALPRTDLSKFGAVVVGTRAYEASETLVANNARLLDYARAGGTLVVQYGQFEMTQPGIMPHPITLARPADRVTVEGAPVTVIDPSAAVLASPNTITTRDFDGWIQDRTLYMPRTFDPAYKPVLEMNDPGEAPNRGAILVASYGKGTYVYTTLAFFRQLPNGNPGAARLMINLLSARAAVQP
ncbi:MAG: PIG-L family deacetylase [Gemmatimonadetes bacterium]|nr:PIG-L family deacetylase [Gemmatimonadota bacterium]